MQIVSGSGDNAVRVWDASMSAELNMLEGPHQLHQFGCFLEGLFADCVRLG